VPIWEIEDNSKSGVGSEDFREVEGCTLYLVRACHHDSVTVVHQEVLCTNICLDSCAPQICFAWRDLTTTDTNVILLPMTCEQETARKLQFSIHDQIASLAEQQSAEIGRVYDSACGGVETLHDLFRLDYEVNLYHFTLYYYDRAGHLVRTVPPAGVRLVSPPSRATVPSHVMVTTYEYNSLGQPIAKNTPDGGTTTFYYDAKQRLRFSQDARQAALYPQRYSYQQYDSLSRVVESGEAMEYTSMYVAVEDFRTLVDTMNYPVRGKTEWTKTTYTTQTGLHYLHDDTSTVRAQRHLRNRVSSRKTYQGVETVYSYDPHGNVAWVYQNLPGLGGNFIGYEYDLISNRVKQVLYDAHHGDQFYQRYGYDEDGRVTTVESSRDSVIWDRDAEYSYFLHGPLMRIELGEDRLQGLDYTHTIHGWLKAINHPALSIDTTLDPGHDNGMERTAPDVFGMILNYYEGDYLRSYNSGADQSPFNSKTVGSSTEQAYQLTSRNLYNGNISGWSLRTTPVGTPSIPAGQTAPALLTHESLVGYSFRYDVLNRLRTSSFSYYSQGSTSAWNNMGTADYYMSLAYDPNGNIDSMTRHGYAKPGGNVAMDKLTYSYPTTPGSENNRLRHVKDSESAGYYSNDIDDEPDDNYLYDPSGNLIYDQSEGTLIRWNAQGKVTQVRKITATVKKDLIYIYDGAGERIAKKELDYLAAMDSSWVTYYVRDAGEKVIAVYRQKLHYSDTSDTCPPGVPGSGMDTDADGIDETPPNFCDNCNSTITPTLPPEFTYRNPWQEDYDGDGIGDACDPCPFGPGDECGTPLSDTAVVPMSKWIPSGFAVLAEWHIYGSSVQGRVGIWKPEKNRDTTIVADTIFTRILTMKEYELKDHLGNVTVVISDLKTATTGGGAPFGVDVKSFSHYYPFGMLQPAAYGSNREYRFGYNGKESDNDWKGEGNVYDFGERIYDSRLGRWLSIDPAQIRHEDWSPYIAMGNRPTSLVDVSGRDTITLATNAYFELTKIYLGIVSEFANPYGAFANSGALATSHDLYMAVVDPSELSYVRDGEVRYGIALTQYYGGTQNRNRPLFELAKLNENRFSSLVRFSSYVYSSSFIITGRFRSYDADAVTSIKSPDDITDEMLDRFFYLMDMASHETLAHILLKTDLGHCTPCADDDHVSYGNNFWNPTWDNSVNSVESHLSTGLGRYSDQDKIDNSRFYIRPNSYSASNHRAWMEYISDPSAKNRLRGELFNLFRAESERLKSKENNVKSGE
jgi:RHS repeat-associated protein